MIDLRTPLSLRSSFAFPLQTAEARREVLVGAAWVLVPVAGWLLNMGHRVVMVHRMMHGQPAWPSWRDHGQLLRHGLVTFGGMVYYYLPGAALGWLGWRMDSRPLAAAGAVLGVLATLAIPGYMTHYCRDFDAREIFDPLRALSRALQGGAAYWRAWGIALCALALSFVGLLGLGVAFLATSVWFWQVAGFSFARVFSQKYILRRAAPAPRSASNLIHGEAAMPTRRTGEAFEDTVRLTVVGDRLAAGDPAPAWELDTLRPGAAFPEPVRLEDTAGQVRLLNVINSIDTPVCHVETCRWQTLLGELPAGVVLYTISMDLPFALLRWQTAEGMDHGFLSSHRGERFGVDYGVLLEEWRLLQRAVFVIDGEGCVAHAEYVADQMKEPDYDAALGAVRRLASAAPVPA